MCEFNIQELNLANYRRFENETFTLNAAFKTYVPSRFVFNIKTGDVRWKAQISDDNTILTTGMVPQYPSGVSCTAQWDKSEEPIKFQRVVLKEDARTKFGGSNPMQPTVVEWERKISEADHSDEDVVLPLVLYLSSARLWKDGNKTSVKKGVFSRTDAYSHCIPLYSDIKDGCHGRK